jgi:P27 family predicted phage terminase small subunit
MRRKKTAVPKPPEHLDDEGRKKWGEVFAILDGRGDDIDAGILDALACYASAWSQWVQAEGQVKALGMVVKSAAGFATECPYLTVARKAQTELRKWGDVLQITPKSKAKGTARTANTAGRGKGPAALDSMHHELKGLRLA